MAGGSGPLMSPLPTKLLMGWEDIGTDHPDVPAEFYIYDAYGKGLSQEPQKTMVSFTVASIWYLFYLIDIWYLFYLIDMAKG